MTSAVGFTSITPSALTAQSNAASTAQQQTVSGNASSGSLVQPQVQSISPHIVADPVAGLITQYLNSAGKVESQYPSATVVAYLKAGLTAQGQDRHRAEQTTGSTSATA